MDILFLLRAINVCIYICAAYFLVLTLIWILKIIRKRRERDK